MSETQAFLTRIMIAADIAADPYLREFTPGMCPAGDARDRDTFMAGEIVSTFLDANPSLTQETLGGLIDRLLAIGTPAASQKAHEYLRIWREFTPQSSNSKEKQ